MSVNEQPTVVCTRTLMVSYIYNSRRNRDLSVPQSTIAYCQVLDVRSTDISSVAWNLCFDCQYGQSGNILFRGDWIGLQRVTL